MIHVHLDEHDLEKCKSHARQIVSYFDKLSSLGSGSYSHNNVGSNLVGVKSEMAVKHWFAINGFYGIKCGYEKFRSSKGDLGVEGWSIEVKGLRPQQWEEHKRCIPPKQLDKYVQRNAMVVWTTTTGDTKSKHVTMRGWNFATDVYLRGIPRVTICDNVGLANDDDMRKMETLLTTLRTKNPHQTELPLTRTITI